MPKGMLALTLLNILTGLFSGTTVLKSSLASRTRTGTFSIGIKTFETLLVSTTFVVVAVASTSVFGLACLMKSLKEGLADVAFDASVS
jgi:hypothetical protein